MLIFLKLTIRRTRVVLKELLYDQIRPQSKTIFERQSEETMSLNQENLPPRYSGRVIGLPTRYGEITEAQVVVFDNEQDDPLTYQHVMEDPDKEKWKDAMNLETKSMYSNSVWELVDPLEEIRPIRCKWIYKRKIGLLAKGYTQKKGVDYEETFSPIAMLKSVRILLSIDVCLDYKI